MAKNMLDAARSYLKLSGGRRKTKQVKTHKAVVKSYDEDKHTASVIINGGTMETPARSSVACKGGDTVNVQVVDHRATVVGNLTAPSTDDTAADAAQETADTARKEITELDNGYAAKFEGVDGDIATLQATDKELSSQLEDAEGNISTLQQTATDFTSQIQDTNDNVSSLQQTATDLTAQLQDAEGNISTLQQTATDFTSQIQDTNDNVSSLQQTATDLTAQLQDAEGNISTLQQTATDLTSQIRDAEGNISTLQQTAADLTSQIEDTNGNLSSLQQTVDGFDFSVYATDEELQTAKEAAITASADAIASYVSAAGGETSYEQANDKFTWSVTTPIDAVDQSARDSASSAASAASNAQNTANGASRAASSAQSTANSASSSASSAYSLADSAWDKADNAQNAANSASSAASNAAKTATDYLVFSSFGLDVGYSGSNYKTRITSSGVQVMNGSTVMVTYGADSVEFNTNGVKTTLSASGSFGMLSSAYLYLKATNNVNISAGDYSFNISDTGSIWTNYSPYVQQKLTVYPGNGNKNTDKDHAALVVHNSSCLMDGVYVSGGLSYDSSTHRTSSRKIKENVRKLSDSDALALLNAEPVTFDYREKWGGDKGQDGFIAEDFCELFPNKVSIATHDDEDGEILGIDYESIIPNLVRLCQLQQKQIDALDRRITALEDD